MCGVCMAADETRSQYRTRPYQTTDGKSAFLINELSHYRHRWRATEHVVEQRLTMLLAGLGSVLGGSAILLTRNAMDGQVSTTYIIAGIWSVLAVVAEGIFLRLVTARLSICRSIHIINVLRRQVAGSVGATRTMASVYCLDNRPPPEFSLISSVAAALMIQTSASFVALWLAVTLLDVAPSIVAVLLAALILAGNTATYYHLSAKQKVRLGQFSIYNRRPITPQRGR